MGKNSSGFYTDFEVFLYDSTKLMYQNKTLSDNWLKSIGKTMGYGFLAQLLSTSLKYELPFNPKEISSVSIGHAMTKTIGDLISKIIRGKVDFSEEQEMDRLEKAKLLFYEYQITLSDKQKEEMIDELCDDLVSGEDILY